MVPTSNLTTPKMQYLKKKLLFDNFHNPRHILVLKFFRTKIKTNYDI